MTEHPSHVGPLAGRRVRRPARRMFAFCAALSLLLCVAVGALWVRNLFTADTVAWVEQDRDARDGGNWQTRSRGVALHSGGLVIGTVTETSRGGAAIPPGRAMHSKGWQHSHGDGLAKINWRDHGPLGFGWVNVTMAPAGINLGFTARAMRVPFWFLLVAAAALPSALAVRRLRERLARRRADPCRCAACGYDLRATPARCPECGRATVAAAAAQVLAP